MRAVPEVPTELTLLTGERFAVDGHGYLTDPQDWTQSFAEYVAREEGLLLTARHWELIDWIRAEEEANGIMPDETAAADPAEEVPGG